MFLQKKDESVQELIGFERFTQYGVTVRKHELLYFIVQPCNISVMSPENVSLKIIALTNITATARQFAFVYPLRDMKPEQVFQTANRIEKAIADQGFEVRRAGITDIKQMLAQYFNTAMNGGAVPDVDGGQHFKSKGGET